MAEYHNGWSKIYDKRLKELGFNSIFDKVKGIHPNQRSDAAVLAFTAATIALGVGLTIANGDRLFDDLFGKDKSNSK
jgi:hypothetical protein